MMVIKSNTIILSLTKFNNKSHSIIDNLLQINTIY